MRRSAIKAKLFPVLAAVTLLCGCSSLLNRSYSVVEPYTDRYWDSTAEDTLKAENYQDLVNSLLMLIQQGSEEGIIRYYAPDGEDGYTHAINAKQEVRTETILGSYLLDALSLNCTEENGYCTLTYRMYYRKNTQEISSLMAISDCQSLVDLLRVSVREELPSLTAQFISKTSCEEVRSAVETLWQELYVDEMAVMDPPSEETLTTIPHPPPEETPTEDTAKNTDKITAPPEQSTELPTGESSGQLIPPEQSEQLEPANETPTEPEIVIPPCPWGIRFYPNSTSAEIVEILLLR